MTSDIEIYVKLHVSIIFKINNFSVSILVENGYYRRRERSLEWQYFSEAKASCKSDGLFRIRTLCQIVSQVHSFIFKINNHCVV